jgi:hypothetical protein
MSGWEDSERRRGLGRAKTPGTTPPSTPPACRGPLKRGVRRASPRVSGSAMFIPGCEPTGHIDFVLKARGGEVEMVGNSLRSRFT